MTLSETPNTTSARRVGDGGVVKPKSSSSNVSSLSPKSIVSSQAIASTQGDDNSNNTTFDFPNITTTAAVATNTSNNPDNSSSFTIISLKPLLDEGSDSTAVAKTCLQLTQYASHNNSKSDEHSNVVYDAGYAKTMSASWQALIPCLQNARDRQCRLLAITTLAITARSAYARLRPSPLLFGSRTAVVVEDEVGSDVPTALCNAALDDPDDGVAAAALQAVGHIVLSSSSSSGALLVEDGLLPEIKGLMTGAASPYAPSLRSVVDEDPVVAMQELQVRIFENVLSPRLLQLVDRILRFHHGTVALTLPVLTACLVYNMQVHPAVLFSISSSTDKSTYAKRWSELDTAGLVDTVVQGLILPGMQSTDGNLAHCAALQGLRLAAQAQLDHHHNQHWITTVCRWAVTVFREESSAVNDTETRLGVLASMLIALRALPLQERTRTLIWMTHEVMTLPSTVPIPTACAGLRIKMGGGGGGTEDYVSYRRPARVALWTEMALHFFIDGPCCDSIGRDECLKVFLSGFTSLMSDPSATGVLVPRDELLLAFTQTAVETGRRFRGDIVADPNCPEVHEWLKLVWVVLTAFLPCAFVPFESAYLDENLSLLSAGLASYVQLLQEYLHFVGLLHPSSSVALKLGANACPPHILWDRMTESAAFLAKFETIDLDAMENTTKLMDELVAREIKQGIPSHHMRLFVLALAADHWVQGRIAAIRKQFESTSAKVDSLTLNMQSGREILLALAPKRMLAKITKAHVPAVDKDGKPKRDPIKKLALESLRVSVACIENIALMACDWRRRFGSSQESKHIVSVAVGLLQGKVDETPVDDLMKSVMGPTCDAAVGRIQAFYESGPTGGGIADQSTPLSELVTQPFKIKIKPLVSPSSKPNQRPKDDIMREYLTQLCRQIVSSRIQLSVQASPPADAMLSPARPVNWLRLSVPPVPESKDGRLYGCRGDALAAWGHSVREASTASDPAQVITAYTPRRYLRYDGEDEYRITILMKAFNMTPIDFVEGLRLEVGIVQNESELEEDPASLTYAESLGCKLEDLTSDLPLVSSAVIYKHEIKSGEFITWEVALDEVPTSSALSIVPSVVYRNVPVEPDDAGAKWVGGKPSQGETSTAGGESKSGEDDFQVTSSVGAQAFKGENAVTSNVRLTGQPLPLPPMICFQPCPLVFFLDHCGDADSFRFLWFRFPHQLAPMKIVEQGEHHPVTPHPTTRKIAKMSSLTWDGEAVPGGVATRLWAFMTLSGERICCVLTCSESHNSRMQQQALHFRGDDKALLFSLVGSKRARESVVSSLLPGMVPAN